jgi:hypothetical protein
MNYGEEAASLPTVETPSLRGPQAIVSIQTAGRAPVESPDPAVLPWWRWPLYVVSVILGPGVITIIGRTMWRRRRYTRVGRNMFWLSWMQLLLILIVVAVSV